MNEQGIRVWRSAESFSPDSLPAEHHATLPPGAVKYEDLDVSRGDEYYYLFEVFRDEDSAWEGPFLGKALPILTGPGSQTLIAGDHRTGFYGEVDSSELIDGMGLAALLNITQGEVHNNDTPWLKFNLDGRSLFLPKQTIRHSISHDALVEAGVVYGGEDSPVITTNTGDQFQVRLLTGLVDSGTYTAGGEWNRLMYPISSTTDSLGWGVNYTNSDLNVGTGDGRHSWTQETDPNNPGRRVNRGSSSVEDLRTASSSFSGAAARAPFGWRPVLEFISPA